jgi:hypothetical protein
MKTSREIGEAWELLVRTSFVVEARRGTDGGAGEEEAMSDTSSHEPVEGPSCKDGPEFGKQAESRVSRPYLVIVARDPARQG